MFVACQQQALAVALVISCIGASKVDASQEKSPVRMVWQRNFKGVASARWSPDSSCLALVAKKRLVVVDAATGTELWERADVVEVTNLTQSNELLVRYGSGKREVLSFKAGELVREFSGPSQPITALSPDGYFYSCSRRSDVIRRFREGDKTAETVFRYEKPLYGESPRVPRLKVLVAEKDRLLFTANGRLAELNLATTNVHLPEPPVFLAPRKFFSFPDSKETDFIFYSYSGKSIVGIDKNHKAEELVLEADVRGGFVSGRYVVFSKEIAIGKPGSIHVRDLKSDSVTTMNWQTNIRSVLPSRSSKRFLGLTAAGQVAVWAFIE